MNNRLTEEETLVSNAYEKDTMAHYKTGKI